MCHDAVPDGVLNTNPQMEEFSISCNGTLKLLQNMKPFKAAGPDKLKPLMLKELREEIAHIIQVIFERCLQTGKLPADWRKARVTPVFKKGTKSSAANYRPMSLTCILCKVIEQAYFARSIASNVVKHLNAHGLLYDLQHGFREKRSRETHFTMLVEDLARSVSQGEQTDLILLDFSKPFDKVNHAKLPWKLHQYGIRENALAWILAFLEYTRFKITAQATLFMIIIICKLDYMVNMSNLLLSRFCQTDRQTYTLLISSQST